MFTGELVTIKGVQTGYLYDEKDWLKKYPYPINSNLRVVKNFQNDEKLKEYINNLNCFPTPTVYLVTKNADFTEGRGPMLPHKAFKNIFDAEEYISKQGGIYGSKQHRVIRTGTNINNKVYAYVDWNGFEIKTMALE